jgi:hypothetical protein
LAAAKFNAMVISLRYAFGSSKAAVSVRTYTSTNRAVWLSAAFISRNTYQTVRPETPCPSYLQPIRDSRFTTQLGSIVSTMAYSRIIFSDVPIRHSGALRRIGQGRPEGTSTPSVAIPQSSAHEFRHRQYLVDRSPSFGPMKSSSGEVIQPDCYKFLWRPKSSKKHLKSAVTSTSK